MKSNKFSLLMENWRLFLKEAIVDTVSDKLSDIFDDQGKLKKEVRSTILNGVQQIKANFKDVKVLDSFVVGASVTYQFADNSDIDTSVVIDTATPKEKLKEINNWIGHNLDNKHYFGKRPYQWKAQFGTRDQINHADAAYDAVADTWIKKPDAEQSKRMFQSKIGDEKSADRIKYSRMEQLVQPSLQRLYRALSSQQLAEDAVPAGADKPDLKTLIDSAYKRYDLVIKKFRGKAYDSPTEKGYVSQNWGSGNVIYKMFDREGYNEVFSILKSIIKQQAYYDKEKLSSLKASLQKVINDEIGYNP